MTTEKYIKIVAMFTALLQNEGRRCCKWSLLLQTLATTTEKPVSCVAMFSATHRFATNEGSHCCMVNVLQPLLQAHHHL
jgi:hypothetical protein